MVTCMLLEYNGHNSELEIQRDCGVVGFLRFVVSFLLEGLVCKWKLQRYTLEQVPTADGEFHSPCLVGRWNDISAWKKRSKTRARCDKHSPGSGFCREKVWPLRMHTWPQPMKRSQKSNPSTFHGSAPIMPPHIKTYPRREKPRWSTLFLCIVGPLLKKAKEVMALVKLKLWLGITHRSEH